MGASISNLLLLPFPGASHNQMVFSISYIAYTIFPDKFGRSNTGVSDSCHSKMDRTVGGLENLKISRQISGFPLKWGYPKWFIVKSPFENMNDLGVPPNSGRPPYWLLDLFSGSYGFSSEHLELSLAD